MVRVPSQVAPAGRDRSLIALGIVLAVMLVALLALPFIMRMRAAPTPNRSALSMTNRPS